MAIVESTRSELLKPLQTIAGIVERRHTMPILSNVLIENREGILYFIGTDLEIQMTTRGPEGGGGAIQLTTSVRKFLDILRGLPADAPVRLEIGGDQLHIRSGRGTYHLQTLPSADFPLMKTQGEVKVAFSIKEKELHDMLFLVQYAMAVQDIRYYLMGVLFQLKDNYLNLVATDGHRLAYATCTLEGQFPDIDNIIVPRKTVLELTKLLSAPEETVTVELFNDKIRFHAGDTVILSKVIDAKFPNYQSVIPLDNKNIFTVEREQLLHALERVSPLANEKVRGVNFSLKPGELCLACSNSEQEIGEESLEIAYQGQALDLSFNLSYLLDVLRSVPSDLIQLSLGTYKSSALFTIPGEDYFKYVLMPMRI